MVDDILSTLNQMLIEERRDLRSLSGSPSMEKVAAMSARMSEAVNMVMQLQDLLLTDPTLGQTGQAFGQTGQALGQTGQAAFASTSASASTSALLPKRGRGALKGEFLCPEVRREAYVAHLTHIIDHHFVDATHMDVTSVKADADIKTTHFFACLFMLESKQPYVVKSPANKSFYDLVHEAAMQSQHASSFSMSYPSLNKCIGELHEFQISPRGEGRAHLLDMDREDRMARRNKWQREMEWMRELRQKWPSVELK